MNTYYFGMMKFNTKNPEQQKWADATDIIFFNQNDRGSILMFLQGEYQSILKIQKKV